jgi:hypothetical protein
MAVIHSIVSIGNECFANSRSTISLWGLSHIYYICQGTARDGPEAALAFMKTQGTLQGKLIPTFPGGSDGHLRD